MQRRQTGRWTSSQCQIGAQDVDGSSAWLIFHSRRSVVRSRAGVRLASGRVRCTAIGRRVDSQDGEVRLVNRIRLCLSSFRPVGLQSGLSRAGWWATANEIASKGRRLISTYMLVAFSTYLRPSELLAIRRRDLVPPSIFVENHWSLVVAGCELDHWNCRRPCGAGFSVVEL